MLIEGFIDYQNCFVNNFTYNFDNLFVFNEGYIGEHGFVDSADLYYSASIGYGNADGAPAGYVSNNYNGELSLSAFKSQLNSASYNKPSIGAWYDQESQQIFLSREIFGKVPLFYIHIPNQFFAFSTSLVSLIQKEHVKRHLAVNVDKIIPYCSRRHPNFAVDASSTFLTNIKSALPGHLLSATSAQVTSTVYAAFNLEKWRDLNTIERAAEAVGDSLREAVLHATGQKTKIVGSHLSGGLDSSSVSSVFKQLFPDRPLHTIHIGAVSNQSDESNFASFVADKIGSVHHIVPQSEDDLKYLELSTRIFGQPESSFLSSATNCNTIRLAREFGCDILLNGHGGDSVIGNGIEQLGLAFDSRDWPVVSYILQKRVRYFPLASQYANWDNLSEATKNKLVVQNFLYRKLTYFRSLPWHEQLQLHKEVSKELGISYMYFVRRAVKNMYLRAINENVNTTSSLVRSEILHSSAMGNIADQVNFPTSLRGGLPAEFQELFEDVFHPHVIRTQEGHFFLGEHFGVSKRSPYMDHKLFEQCMAIPNMIKFGDGIGRAHLREAMKGILAEEVRTRSTKSSLSSPDGDLMTTRLYEQSQEYLYDTKQVWDFIDRKKFDEQVSILKNKKIPYAQKTKTYFHITRTISLSVWLEWFAQQK
ncbi:asparagine synthase-related protein [Dyadobacter sp. CY347]|uniref:asparagine synthase-related protein n=1 Tax=Dyadobacter sp. CY347 TaxID=2909336 RepID=UPI001F3BEB90|nr:asparagine synthase-related protein [Dyadobacter sp. CY347]MCF2491179.1 asparagine synthase-related protein [Dyadobacter sp. CY347]